MKFKCPVCKKVETIDWTIQGFGLKTMVIELECKHCNNIAEIIITFLDNKKPKVDVKSTRPDYLG
jgi:transcription elongation factor Elf1